MLVSVPYGIYGGVAAEDKDAANALLMAAWRLLETEGADVVDLRSAKAVDPALPINRRYATFRRVLPAAVDDVLEWLPRKARAAARNARNRHGLTVDFDDRHLRTVWNLYCRSMRRLASLNYPYSFFEKLVDLTPGQHIVSLVRYENRPIGGLVTLFYDGVAMPYFVGYDPDYTRMGINNFIYLTAMERSVELGCRVFDFGRTRRDNTGCFNFKRYQGFEPQYLEYQRLVAPGARQPNLTPTNPRFGLARRIWPHLPISLTRWMGACVSRHVPG
jgi:FemAB-related protein (PEP-CTERM system-associated)